MTDIDKVSRLFRRLSRMKILEAKNRSKARMIERFSELNFVLNSIVTAPAQKLSIQMIDSSDFAIFMAGEANRFYLASMISLERSKSDTSVNLAWQVVEHYYAAYYAVHYLMRIAGFSITNIDKPTLAYILRSGLGVSSVTNLSSGLNLLSYDKDCNYLDLTKKIQSGGSHKDAWEIWLEIIGKLSSEASNDIVEYSSVAVSLSEHASFLRRSNGAFSPTEIRNEINYQFKNNSWCFEVLPKEKLMRVRRAIEEATTNLSDSGDVLLNLINHNNFVLSLAKKVFNQASSDFGSGICRSLVNQYKLKIPAMI